MIKWVTSFFHLLLPIKLIRRIAQYNSTRYSVIGDKNVKDKIYLHTPNQICDYRIKSLFTKEPDTIDWLKKYQNNKILFDIGSNVGLYSIYFSKLNQNNKVFAFDGCPFNNSEIQKNIVLNNISIQVTVCNFPLFSSPLVSKWRQNGFVQGSSMMSFGVNFGFDGNPAPKRDEFNIIGFSIDFLVENKILPIPDIIKIDVDGAEHLILNGAKKTLHNKKCKSVLVEINEDFNDQLKSIINLMTTLDFNLSSINLSPHAAGRFLKTKNYIFERD